MPILAGLAWGGLAVVLRLRQNAPDGQKPRKTAYADENTVTFGGALERGNQAKNDLSRKIKAFIEEKVQERRKQNSQVGSMAEEITKLKKLHEDGALSDDEFAAAKAKLLS